METSRTTGYKVARPEITFLEETLIHILLVIILWAVNFDSIRLRGNINTIYINDYEKHEANKERLAVC